MKVISLFVFISAIFTLGSLSYCAGQSNNHAAANKSTDSLSMYQHKLDSLKALYFEANAAALTTTTAPTTQTAPTAPDEWQGATYKTRDGITHQLITGKRGGHYYINSKGNKVYPKLPK